MPILKSSTARTILFQIVASCLGISQKDYPKGKGQVECLAKIIIGPAKTEAKETKGIQLEDKLKLNDVLRWDGNTYTHNKETYTH